MCAFVQFKSLAKNFSLNKYFPFVVCFISSDMYEKSFKWRLCVLLTLFFCYLRFFRARRNYNIWAPSSSPLLSISISITLANPTISSTMYFYCIRSVLTIIFVFVEYNCLESLFDDMPQIYRLIFFLLSCLSSLRLQVIFPLHIRVSDTSVCIYAWNPSIMTMTTFIAVDDESL